MFAPLARAYKSELLQLTFRSQGLLLVKKSDFILIFRKAYASSFTEKNILKAFEATGI
jgi:hypothetical protein